MYGCGTPWRMKAFKIRSKGCDEILVAWERIKKIGLIIGPNSDRDSKPTFRLQSKAIKCVLKQQKGHFTIQNCGNKIWLP